MKHDAKKIIKVAGLAFFFLFVAGYAFFRSYDLIFGVKIKNVNLSDGQKFENSIVEVTGNADRAVMLTLNGREISIEMNGDFRETIALLSGYNIISIVAEDKFGKTDEKNYQVVHQPNNFSF